MANQGEDEKSNGVEQEYSPHGDADLFLVCAGDGGNGGDGAAATDSSAGRDQERRLACNLKQTPKEQAEQHGAGNADCCVEEAGAAGIYHLLQIHAEPEGNDRSLQKQPGQRTALTAEWMLDGEAKCHSTRQRDGWGDHAAGGQQKAYKKEGLAVRCRAHLRNLISSTFPGLAAQVQAEIVMRNK